MIDRMAKLGAAVTLGLALPAPEARADSVEDALTAALEAWRAGDVRRAKQELDYAAALVDDAQAESLRPFLPAARTGWTRMEGEASAAPAAMFGGGLSASAVYTRGGERFEISLFADNPMVAAMAPMLATPQMMAMAGDVRRNDGQTYVVTGDGEIMALVGGRVLVRVEGAAPEDAKIAHFEAIDFRGLGRF